MSLRSTPSASSNPPRASNTLAAGGQARAGDGGNFTGRGGHVEIAGGSVVEPGQHVIGRAAHADDHAAMLESPIGIEQAGADRADLGTHGLRRQDVDPARFVRLDVIVEEEEDVARSPPAAAALLSSDQLNGRASGSTTTSSRWASRSISVWVSGCTEPLSTSTKSTLPMPRVASIDSMQARMNRGSSRKGMMMVVLGAPAACRRTRYVPRAGPGMTTAASPRRSRAAVTCPTSCPVSRPESAGGAGGGTGPRGDGRPASASLAGPQGEIVLEVGEAAGQAPRRGTISDPTASGLPM